MRDGDKLMVIGAVYALNLSVFLIFGIDATRIWLDIAVTLAIAAIAYRLARHSERELKPFFTLLMFAAVFNIANLVVWNTGLSVQSSGWSSQQGSNEFPLSYGFLSLFLLLWDFAWLYLAVTLVRRQGFGLANWIVLLVLLGFIGAYVQQYREFNFMLLDAEHRLFFLFFLLELVGVLLGVMCTLLGVTRPYLLMVVGFAVFAAIHLVGIHELLEGRPEESVRLQPLWTLGRAFVIAGLWFLNPPSARSVKEPTRSADPGHTVDLVERGRQYSQLSSLLIVFVFGAVFVVAATDSALAETPQWFGTFFVLFCVTCAIFMSLATRRFDRSISYVRAQMAGVFDSKLSLIRAGDGESGVQRTLQLSGLQTVLTEFRHAARELRNDVIVLGPERLNRPTGQRSARTAPRCFIVMPFGATWSTDVNRLIRETCTGCGVHAVRGDDIFSPTDILDDIWKQIIDADFIIADVTDRNTNVFYELGMAHAVGKPVIILSQREDDVPIDLKTRRWLPYDPKQPEDLASRLRSSIEQVVKMYELSVPVDEES